MKEAVVWPERSRDVEITTGGLGSTLSSAWTDYSSSHLGDGNGTGTVR